MSLYYLAPILALVIVCALCILYCTRNAKAPEGHHYMTRNGVRYLRRNPKRSLPNSASKPAYAGGASSDLSTNTNNSSASLGNDGAELPTRAKPIEEKV